MGDRRGLDDPRIPAQVPPARGNGGGVDQPVITWTEDPWGLLELYDTGSPVNLLTITVPGQSTWRIEVNVAWSSPADDDSVHPRFTLLFTDSQGGPDIYQSVRAR